VHGNDVVTFEGLAQFHSSVVAPNTAEVVGEIISVVRHEMASFRIDMMKRLDHVATTVTRLAAESYETTWLLPGSRIVWPLTSISWVARQISRCDPNWMR
jgi:hypothetical protein